MLPSTESEISRLIKKYSGQLPRYTSYPTAVEFRPMTAAEWKVSLAELSNSEKFGSSSEVFLSLYLHIPFCHSLCYFCACNKLITNDPSVTAPYLEKLARELQTYAQMLRGKNLRIVQLHLGGGSPNYLTPDEMERLFSSVKENFPNIANDGDISIELDPRTTTRAQLEVLQGLGFNRLSLGVQDFSKDVQEAINRIQSYEETKNLCDEARQLGFRSINIDLIYGLPLQTDAGFSATLDRVLEIRPERIALYGYAHVTWKKKVQNTFHRFNLPTPEERIALFTSALKRLTEAGYVYIGMDHFALPSDSLTSALAAGTLNRNFMGYTTHRGAHVLGVGVSAISSIGDWYAQNTLDLGDYAQMIDRFGVATFKGLKKSTEDVFRGELIRSVLCDGRVDFEGIKAHNADSLPGLLREVQEELEEFERDGLVRMTADSIVVTQLGRLFSRNIASLFDAYLGKHRGSGRVFSQSL